MVNKYIYDVVFKNESGNFIVENFMSLEDIKQFLEFTGYQIAYITKPINQKRRD